MADVRDDALTSALTNVDARRRGFLQRLLAGGAAAAALPVMSTVCLADDSEDADPGKGKGGKGKGERPDPAAMAARMIQQFDKDGDNKLDVKELTAALTALRERSGKGKGDAKGKGKGKGKGTETE